MKFGLFEHMDDSGVPLGQQFESRLSLLEACDRYGFYAYHLAEHHGDASRSRAIARCVSRGCGATDEASSIWPTCLFSAASYR
jgi:hypothetical protein